MEEKSMARRAENQLPSNHRNGTPRDDPERVEAEALVDGLALDANELDPDHDVAALSDDTDEADELVIEVELYDDDELGDIPES
jgi:hypothetical protein